MMRATTLLLLTAAALLASAAAGATAAAPSLEPDVSYDQGSPPADPRLNQLDIWAPNPAPAEGSAPVVVYIHGGAWRVGDKGNGMLNMAQLFTDQGYLFVSVNYRLSPDPPNSSNPARIRYPAHPHDIGEAVGWIRSNIAARGGNASRLILAGHSAGAQLASLVATDPSFLRAYGTSPLAVRGVVALDGAAYDLTERADPAASTLRPAALEGLWNAFATPAENAAEATWAAASSTLRADRRDAPHLLVTQPNPIRIGINRALAAALQQDPDGVVVVDLSHAEIRAALGSPDDSTVETESVTEFVAAALATDSSPKTKLKRKPAKRVRLRGGKRAKVRFGFSTGDPRARLECRIDKRKWKTCSAPKSYKLGEGKHRFRVRSKNRDGKGEIRSYRFRVKG